MMQFREKKRREKERLSFPIIPAKFARRDRSAREGDPVSRTVKGCPRVSRSDTRLRERSLEARVDTVFERERGYTCYRRAERRESRVSPREIEV